MIRHLLLVALMLAWFAPGYGQPVGPANPFELVHRLPKVSADGQAAAPGNPFDIVAHRSPGPVVRLGGAAAPAKPFTALPRGSSLSRAALFWVLVGVFGFLTLSIAANRPAVERSWRGFLSDNALALAQREASGLVGSTPYFLLYGNFLLNAGIFIFLIVRSFMGETFNNLSFLIICMGGAVMAFLSKHVLLGLMRWLFRVDAEVKRYNFLIIIFNCVLGLFLVPFNFLIAFSGEYQYFLVFWTLGLIAIFYFYRSLRASRIGRKFLEADQFHFLLYLCAVELAPVLWLVKLALLQLNS